MVAGKREPSFKGLIAWQKADRLVDLVFEVAEALPSRLGWLASQALRSAVSVTANIAEGYGRGSLGDYLRFLEIARGSLNELECYLMLISRRRLVGSSLAAEVESAHAEAGRVLTGLYQATRRKNKDTWDRFGRNSNPK